MEDDARGANRVRPVKRRRRASEEEDDEDAARDLPNEVSSSLSRSTTTTAAVVQHRASVLAPLSFAVKRSPTKKTNANPRNGSSTNTDRIEKGSASKLSLLPVHQQHHRSDRPSGVSSSAASSWSTRFKAFSKTSQPNPPSKLQQPPLDLRHHARVEATGKEKQKETLDDEGTTTVTTITVTKGVKDGDTIVDIPKPELVGVQANSPVAGEIEEHSQAPGNKEEEEDDPFDALQQLQTQRVAEWSLPDASMVPATYAGHVPYRDHLTPTTPVTTLSPMRMDELKIKDSQDMLADEATGKSTPPFIEAMSQVPIEADTSGVENGEETTTGLSPPTSAVALSHPDFGLPGDLIKAYAAMGVASMYSWQAEALRLPGILAGTRNMVYYAPTSAGKTFVAEILLVKRFLKTGKKALFVLPYIALVTEKVQYLQQLWSSPKVRVAGFYAGRAEHWDHLDVAICTTEKANSLVNRLIEEGRMEEIGCIVIDELHMVGQKDRGGLLELLLTKIRILVDDQIQIVAMSATLPNLSTLARWLDAALYETDYRPIPLTEFVLHDGRVYDRQLNVVRTLPYPKVPEDTGQLIPLCWETLRAGGQVLIFISSKQQCESCARLLWRLMNVGSNAPAIQQGRQAIVDALQKCAGAHVNQTDRTLFECVLRGIAWHHAGLTVEERDIIETAFHQGFLTILCATSTVAAGVNLPARRVIFRSISMGMRALGPQEYHQMKGRAGRKGKDPFGESFIICESPKDFENATALLAATLPPVTSSLAQGKVGLQRALLESIVSGIVKTKHDVQRFFRFSLLGAEETDRDITSRTNDAIHDLLSNRFIEMTAAAPQDSGDDSEDEEAQASQQTEMLSPTKFGLACVASGMSPDMALRVYRYLDEAMDHISLSSDLHMIYLVTPMGVDIQPDWTRYLTTYEQLNDKERNVATIVGIHHGTLCQVAANPSFTLTANTSVKQYRKWEKYRRFWASLMLHQIVQEVPTEQIIGHFGIHRGTLQNLQNSVATTAGQITIFAQRLQWERIRLLVKDFQSRLIFGVERELVDLMQLPHVKASHARALWNAGLKTFAEIASAEKEEILDILVRAIPFQSKRQPLPSSSSASSSSSYPHERKIAAVIHQSAVQMMHMEAVALQKKMQKVKQRMSTKEATRLADVWQPSSTPTSHRATFRSIDSPRATAPPSLLTTPTDALPEILCRPFDKFDPSAVALAPVAIAFDRSQKSFAVHAGGSTVYLGTSIEKLLEGLLAMPPKVQCILPNALHHWRRLYRHVPQFEEVFQQRTVYCTSVAEWLMTASEDAPSSLRDMMKAYLPHYLSKEKPAKDEKEKLARHAVHASYLMSYFKLRLQQMHLWQQFCSTEMPIAHLLATMSARGVCIDVQRMENCIQAVDTYRKKLQKDANQYAGRVVNLDSPKEVAVVLYDTLKLPLNAIGVQHLDTKKKIKRRTSSDILLKLSTLHPFPGIHFLVFSGYCQITLIIVLMSRETNSEVVIKFRRIAHIDVKCLRPFLAFARPDSAGQDRIHCHYQMRSSTGRVYTTDPNLQSMPHPIDAMTFEKDMYALPDVSTSLNFRAATRASPDHLILMIDFHQLELRIVAHLSRDTTLHRYFAEHPDVFQAMADAWFGVSDTEAVQQEQRAKAKRTTYAILYGTGAEGLAAALNVTVEEAHELITDFRTRYPGVTAMKDKIIADGRAHGYVETLSGRRRAMPNLTSPHAATASRGERIAVNTVIQGTASDIVKSGMLRVEAALQDRFAKRQPYLPRLILQIHDELLFDVPRSLLDEAATIIRATLEAVPHWTTGKLPFPIRIKAGPSWGELETYPATA